MLDSDASLVEMLLRVLMDPKVLSTPLERDMMIALDIVVSGISNTRACSSYNADPPMELHSGVG